MGFFFFFPFLVLGGLECAVIHVLSWISTTFLIDLITFPMTESKIETTSEPSGVGSVFDVPGASLVAQQDICLHEGFLTPSFFFFLRPLFLLMVGLHLEHELFREFLKGGQQGRRELNREVIF